MGDNLTAEPRWEPIGREADGTETSRLRVPGGWLYRVQWQFWGRSPAGETQPVGAVALQFVPDVTRG